MSHGLQIPTVAAAEQLLIDAERRNPGPWVAHSRLVAEAARRIAACIPALDLQAAYTLGLLHDIGRRNGITDMRHVIDGHKYLMALGYSDAARICLTHSFLVQTTAAASGQWDCHPDELAAVEDALSQMHYTAYDRLIQLCDCLALPSGFCLLEKRLVDVALRHGFNAYTIEKWRVTLRIMAEFEAEIGAPVYSLLPGVVETTFGSIRAAPPV